MLQASSPRHVNDSKYVWEVGFYMQLYYADDIAQLREEKLQTTLYGKWYIMQAGANWYINKICFFLLYLMLFYFIALSNHIILFLVQRQRLKSWFSLLSSLHVKDIIIIY